MKTVSESVQRPSSSKYSSLRRKDGQGRRRRYLKRCPGAEKSLALLHCSDPATDPKSQLSFFLVLTMDPTYFPSNHEPDTESFILPGWKFLSSSHLWLTGAVSSCRWRKERKELDLGRL